MEKIQFDTGVKEFECGGGILRVNFSDYNTYKRLLDMKEYVNNLIDKYETEINNYINGHEKDSMEKQTVYSFDIMYKIDKEVKQELEKVFNIDNDFDKIFNGVNVFSINNKGKMIIQDFIEAIVPIIKKDLAHAEQNEISKYVGNREERRKRNKR